MSLGSDAMGATFTVWNGTTEIGSGSDGNPFTFTQNGSFIGGSSEYIGVTAG